MLTFLTERRTHCPQPSWPAQPASPGAAGADAAAAGATTAPTADAAGRHDDAAAACWAADRGAIAAAEASCFQIF